jgi:hypothetical protein
VQKAVNHKTRGINIHLKLIALLREMEQVDNHATMSGENSMDVVCFFIKK